MFFALAVTAIAAGIGVLWSKSPVNSALWLILNLFCIAGLYLTLNAQFIAVIQVLVYAGAIMVLFLFVIMLLNLAEMPAITRFTFGRMIGFFLAMGVLSLLTYAVAASLDVLPEFVGPQSAAITGSPSSLARALFTEYALPFEIVGVLLLAATIGAVIIAKRKPV